MTAAAAPLPLPSAFGCGRAWPTFCVVVWGDAEAAAGSCASLAAQGYPALETLTAAEPAVEAVNAAFGRATGTVLTLLRAGETLPPGTLAAVAEAFARDPAPQVLAGRARLVDAAGCFTGIVPGSGDDLAALLRPWRSPRLLRPALFWCRAAWEQAGGLITAEQPAAEYGLWCRLLRYGGVVARLERVCLEVPEPEPAEDETEAMALLAARLRAARCCWESWGRPARWRREAEWYGARLAARLSPAGLGPLLAAAFARRLQAPLRRRLNAALRRPGAASGETPAPQTLELLAETRPWPDGRAGPRVVLTPPLPAGDGPLTLRLAGETDALAGPLTLSLRTSGGERRTLTLAAGERFDLTLPAGVSGPPVLEVRASAFQVPHSRHRNHDYRPLSWRLFTLEAAGPPLSH